MERRCLGGLKIDFLKGLHIILWVSKSSFQKQNRKLSKINWQKLEEQEDEEENEVSDMML